MPRRSRCCGLEGWPLLLTLCIAAVSGCSSEGEDPVSPPATASLTVLVDPPSIAAEWLVSGPDGYLQSGTGQRTL